MSGPFLSICSYPFFCPPGNLASAISQHGSAMSRLASGEPLRCVASQSPFAWRYIKSRALDRITVDDLVAEIAPRGTCFCSKQNLLRRFGVFLEKPFVPDLASSQVY